LHLLEIWERGITQAPVARALSLLRAACTEMTAAQLAALTIGQRDARLLALREALFGTDMEAITLCPACGQRMELSLSTRELLTANDTSAPQETALTIRGYDLRLRAPSSQDLLTIAHETPSTAGREWILRRCLLSASERNAPVEFDLLPPEVVETAVQKIAEIDPLADIQMSIVCQSCRHVWKATFDIVSFLWSEIDAWARRVLVEVHTLASAYGWCERDILELSPSRRQIYLDMVGA